MTPLEIQRAIRKNGTTQKSIAQNLDVTEMSVSYVINKKMVSNRIMRAVARAIGKVPTEVFPEYYLEGPKFPRRTSNIKAAV